MKYVMQQIKIRETKQLVSVIQMEIDYELLTLYDALEENDQKAIEQAKKKLEELVEQLKLLTEDSK